MIKVKTKPYDKQLASAYAAYMMCSSAFNKCRCRNSSEEKHLYLHFCEVPDSDKDVLEESVERKLEKLGAPFLKILGNLNCETRLCPGEKYSILFDTGGFETLCAEIDKKGAITITPV